MTILGNATVIPKGREQHEPSQRLPDPTPPTAQALPHAAAGNLLADFEAAGGGGQSYRNPGDHLYLFVRCGSRGAGGIALEFLREGQAMKTAAKHNQRLALYQQGMNDYEIAAACGVTESAIRYWRRTHRLKRNQLPYTVRMEKALTESQAKQMERFLACLTTYADRFPDEQINVLRFAREYREGAGDCLMT